MPIALAASRLLATLLAEFTPLSPQAQLAAVSLLAVALLVLGIRSHFKRQPPLDSELVKLNEAIKGLQKAVDKLTESAEAHSSHATEIQGLKSEVDTLKQHREEDLRQQREYTRKSSHDIFAKLDELKDSVNGNFRAVERAIGQLEGRIEGRFAASR